LSLSLCREKKPQERAPSLAEKRGGEDHLASERIGLPPRQKGKKRRKEGVPEGKEEKKKRRRRKYIYPSVNYLNQRGKKERGELSRERVLQRHLSVSQMRGKKKEEKFFEKKRYHLPHFHP